MLTWFFKFHIMEEPFLKNIFTVSELTYSIKSLLEENFFTVSVKGEIGNFSKHSSGHIYFTLKDKDAQISCALFKGNAKNIKTLPKPGDQVILFGRLSLYPPRGSYQIIVRNIEFVGIGELLLKLHNLKKRLQEKGYFDEKNKKKIPSLAKKIGVVTSKTGAVIQDILNVLNRRYSNFHLLLNPVKVQGEGASEEIASAIKDFNRYDLVDVIIVARGGGSLEDLWAFNEEIVADEIFKSKIPVISAVGHETDITISDLVADVRAPTPSAAAEIAVKEKSQLAKTINTYKIQTLRSIKNIFQYKNSILRQITKHPTFSSSDFLLLKHFQKIDEISYLLEKSIKHLFNLKKTSLKKYLTSLTPPVYFFKQKLSALSENINISMNKKISFIKEILLKEGSFIKSLNPKNLLKKGYSIIFSKKDNSIILSSKDVKKEDKISVLLHDGTIQAKVE